jgi:hypothetical protein
LLIDLFNTSKNQNILPKEGEAIYYGPIVSPQQANEYLQHLLENIEWKNDEAVIFGTSLPKEK